VPTDPCGQHFFGIIIDAHIHGPGGNVSKQHRAQASVHPPNAILDPDGPRSAYESVVYNVSWPCGVSWAEAALCLKSGLDDVEGACHNARSDPRSSATGGIDSGTGYSSDNECYARE